MSSEESCTEEDGQGEEKLVAYELLSCHGKATASLKRNKIWTTNTSPVFRSAAKTVRSHDEPLRKEAKEKYQMTFLLGQQT